MDILNPVLTPNNEFSGIFTVTGKDGQLVRPSFELMMGNAAYVNEVGIYKVDDDLGTINGVKPGDKDYAKLALSGINSHALLGNFQSMGFAMEDLILKSGDRVGFYLASNTTADSVVMHNPENINGNQYRAFFSAAAANADGFDYVQEKVVDGKLQLWWEDIAGGGDRDYDDMVVRMGTSLLDAQNWTPKGNQVFQLAGEIDESVTFKFSMLGSAANYRDEIGLFLVDDAAGSIGNLRPSDEGYKLAALQRGQVLFNSFSSGNTQEITLSGGAFVGLYIVANGNSDQVLNGDRQSDLYLSFLEANDGYDYISRMGNHFYFEDMRGLGDRDYNDMVMRMDWVRNTQSPMLPPTINFNLLKDTGTSDRDRLTADARIVGNVKTTDSGNWYTRLEAKLIDNANSSSEVTEYVDISEFLKNDGSFTLQKGDLSRIFGKNLVDGNYRLQMRVTKELLPPVISNIANNSGVFLVNGALGQPINPYFYLSQVNSGYKNEIGLFKVDDDLGSIDGITPSDPRYLQIALDPSRRKTIFADSANAALITNDIGLQNGDRVAFYLVANAKADEVLARNPKNERSSAGNVFFSILSANPDSDVHMRSQLVDGKLILSWEDLWGGGDRDFNDIELKIGRDGNTFLVPLPENPLSAESVLDFVYDSQIGLEIRLDETAAISPSQPNQTSKDLVDLVGKSDAGANVYLPALSLAAIADSTGAFKFANVKLEVGNNSFAVTATDAAGNENTSSLVVERIALASNLAPTALNLSNNVTPENVAISSVIGNFSSIDPDAGDTHTYSLATGSGSTDNVSFEIAGNQLKWKESPNFEVKNAYSIRVRTTDAGGLTFEQVFNIGVTNVNEAVSFTSSPVTAASEGVAYSYNVSTADIDLNDTRAIAATTIPTWLTFKDNGNGTATLTGTTKELGNYNVVLTVTDAGGLNATQSFTINVANVNDAPTALNLSNNVTPENVAIGSVIGNFSSVDPDAGDTHTYSLAAGTGDVNNGVFEIAGNQLKWKESPNFEVKNAYSIRVRTTDAGGLTFEQVFNIGVTNVNEAVSFTSSPVLAASEGVSYAYSITTADIDLNDTRSISATTIPTWLTFTDNGNGTATLTGTPQTAQIGNHNVVLTVTDAGGLTDTQTFTIAVANVNDAPTALNLSNNVTPENVEIGSVIGSFSSTDPDAGDTHTYSLATGAGSTDNDDFEIVGNGLRWKESPNFEAKNAYSIRVRTTDAGGLTFEQVFSISVTNVNEAPVLAAIANQEISELSAFSINLNGSDVDTNTNLTYSLIGTTPNGLNLTNNVITWTPNEIQDGIYTINAQVSDGELSDSKTFSITVKEVNQNPNLAAIANQEILIGNTASFTASATDSDIKNGVANKITYSITNTIPNGASIDANTGAFTWVTNASGVFNITVTASDDQGGASSQNFSIYVKIPNVAPTDIILNQNVIAENNSANTIVGNLSSTDANLGDLHTYSFVSGEGDSNNSLFSIDGNKLLINFAANYEVKNAYTIRVKSTDNGDPAYSFEKSLTVNIIDVNETPTSIAITNNAISENSSKGLEIGTLSSVDPDNGQTFTYSLINNAGDRFALNSDRLVVNNGALLDFETNTSHIIRVKTTDSGSPNLSYEQDFTINVLNINEAPKFTSNPINSAGAGFVYTYNIATSDPENSDRLITGTNIPAWLTLTDNKDGTAILSGTPQFTDAGLYNIQLKVKESNTVEKFEALQDLIIGVDSLLKENSDFNPERVMNFTTPVEPSLIQFKIKNLSFDTTDQVNINDAFEVALLDAKGNNSLLHTIADGQDAFINLTEGETVKLSPGVTYDSATGLVTLNIVDIAPNTPVQLVFRLVNNDDDTASQVEVTNISITPAPIGTLPPVQSQFALRVAAIADPNPISFLSLADVTTSAQANYARTNFTEGGKVLTAEVNLENIGTYALNDQLVLAVKNISSPSIVLRNADGVTPDGYAYIDFTKFLNNGKLDPTQKSSLGELIFYNPDQIQFTYELVVLAKINNAPEITTNPLLPARDVAEVVGGDAYSYDVNATDKDNDALVFSLLVAPEGMAIDANSGLIAWNTTLDNVGNHSIVVQVADGRGGIDTQAYTLSVTDIPPNRPPIFTTDPVVDAYINQLYKYDADAIDPDLDDVSFNLIIGPNGMTVNRDTGLVQWNPPAALVIGDTVLGRISVPGENDEFSFSGVAGQKIYYDPLNYTGADGNWNFKIITPSGRQVLSTNFVWSSWGLITLDETGNYRVVVDAASDQTGNYGFRLTDPALVPVIQYDEVISDRLSPGNQDRLYRFTAAKDQRLFLDALSRSSATVDWYVINPQDQYIHYTDFSDIEMVMPQDGEYILVARGRAGFVNSVDYTFSLVNPDVITRSMNVGEVVEGAIAKKGGQHTYTFTGTAGQQVFFDSLDGNAYLPYTLYDPFGNVVINRADSRGDRAFLDGFTFVYDGTYKLMFDGDGETIGKYKFRLLDKVSAVAYTPDIDLTGAVDNAASGAKLFKFTIQENLANPDKRQYVYLDGLNATPQWWQTQPGAWILYNSQGQQLNSTRLWDDREMWLGAGDYILVMQGYNGYYYGDDPNYTFRVITSDTPITDITSKIYTNPTNGQAIDGNIAEKGNYDTYTFTGTAGQQLFFDSLANSVYFTYDLIDPQGTVLVDNADIRGDRYFLDGFTLPSNGQYKIVVDGSGETTGAYKFRLLDKSSATPLALDTVLDSTSANDGYNADLYELNISTRQYLYVDATSYGYLPSAWWLTQPGDWVLYNDSGVVIQNNVRLWEDREFWLDPGKYTLAVRGYGSGYEPRYKLSVTTPDLVTDSLALGNIVTGSIAEKGEQDTYTFTASAGEQLFFDSLDGNAALIYSLYSPQGTLLVNNADIRNDRYFTDGLTLVTNGEYKLVVDGNGETTGNYKFRLLSKANATSVSLDSDVTGNFTDASTSAERFKFTLSDRTYLYFDSLPPAGSYTPSTWWLPQTAEWKLYSANGVEITTKRLWEDYETWLDAGEYTLVMRGYGSGYLSDYNLRIVTPDLNTTPLTLGTVVTGAIAEKGEQDYYTFNGNAGQSLYLDLINRGNSQTTKVILTDEYGREVLNRWVSDNDPDAFILSHTGTYKLTFDGNGELTDTYSFSLVDLSTSTDITGNFGKGGAISDIIYNGHAYRLISSSSWENAQEQASSWGANLVTINDSAENQFIRNNLGYNFYIGFTDKEKEGEWKWVSGEPVTYTNWASGQPDNYQGNQNYAYMWSDGRWDDAGGGGNFAVEQTNLNTVSAPISNADSLVDGRSAKFYKFTGTKGQGLILNPTKIPANTNWTLYGASGEVLMHAAANTLQLVSLKADGTYILAIRGNDAASANYEFEIRELNAGTPTTPTSTAINFNQVYSGNLTNGQVATFTFDGTAGQSLFYDAQGGSAFTRYLYDPAGKQVLTINNQAGYASNGDFGSEPQYGQTLAMNGTYTMTIVANGTGSYKFQLMGLPSAQSIKVDEDTFGTYTGGSAGSDAFKLDVATRTYYHIDGKEGDGAIIVYGDNGNYVTSIRTYQDTQFWLDPGQYYFVFQGYSSNANYRAQLVQSEITNLGNIDFNTEVSGTIAKKLTHYSYNFTGQAGQLVMFDALPGDANMRVRIYDPNGRMLNQDDPSYYYGGGQSLNSDRLPDSGLTLSMDGVYTLQVVSYGGIYGTSGTGNYKFRLLDLQSAPTVNLDSTISGTLDNSARGTAVYQFNNTTRQYLFIDGQSGDGDWYIFRADGTRVDTNYIQYNAQFWLDPGQYYLVITARGSNANYQMKIVTPALVNMPEIPFDSSGVSNVISDTIDEKGEQHYYTFQGRAGEKLWIDSLGSDTYLLRYYIYAPNGRLLGNEYQGGIYSDRDYAPDSNTYYGPNPRGFTLLEDGIYSLHVDGYDDRGGSEYTGNYRFRLLDLENAPEVNLDEVIAGTWDFSSLGTKSYKFTNPERQYIYVDGQEGNGDWNIYRADGTRVDGNYVSYNAEFWLDAGEYYLVVSGRSGGTNYKLQLVTPELKTVTTPVAFDTVISDVIDEKGEQHYYTFEGKAGQRIMFDALNTPGLLYTRITDPLGRLIVDEYGGRGIQTNADRFPDQGLTLAFDGTYRITIDGYDDRGNSEYTGAYRFQLIDLDAKPKAGFDVDLNGNFLIGANGKLGGTGYTFTVDRPQYFFFDGQGGTAADAGWALYQPNGTYVTGGKIWEDRETWLNPGEYSLVLYGITPVNTGREKTVLNPANNRYYSLLSGAGSWEALQAKAEALGGNLVTINDAAENQFLVNNFGGDYYIGYTDKEQEGVWKWISGESASYTNWNGGEPNNSGNEDYAYFYSSGKWNDAGNGNSKGVIESDIDPSTFIVQSTYKIQIATPDLISQSYVIGNVVSDTIAIKGDQRYYTFEGKSGQRLYLDSQTKTAGFKIRITDPVGRNLFGDFDTASADDKDNIILSETGTYTLTVDPTGEATGEYRFKLMEYGDRATMPTQITLNSVNPSVTVTGTYDDVNKREADFYRFTSTGKQNIFVDAITGDGNNYWGIYKPNGENLVWGRMYEDKDVYLDAAGQYTLVMWGGGVANNSYEVSLNLTGDQTTAYTLGNAISSNLTVKGENDIYTFSGNAGQMLFFDALTGNTNIKARIYSPTGALISDRDTNADWSPLLLGENGEYRLVIDGSGATIGNYSFVLSDRSAATAIALGATTTAQLNPGNQLDLYRINGVAGKLLNFNLTAPTWTGANWVLYDPSGVAIAAPAANSPDFSRALGATGTYTLAIGGTGTSNLDYSFTVTDITPAAVTKSGLNTNYSGTFTTANQVDEYTFTASAGTVIWYDSMTGTNDWRERVKIINPDGTQLLEGEARYDYGSYTLQQSGTYKVQLRDYYSQATNRNYKFRILELPKNFGFGVNYLELGQPISGTSTEGAAKVYTFQGLQGMQVMFNGMYGTGATAWLYDSNGNLVTSIGDFRNNDNGLTVLKRNDLYNLVIGGSSGQNNAYSFQLLDNISSPKIEYNLNVNRSETNSQNSFLYRVHAEKGQTLYFDNLAFNANGSGYADYYRWQLFSPSGTRITDQAIRYDFETKITETGEYVLYMQGIWEAQAYNYSFRVFSLDPKDINALDVITPGTGASADAGDGSLGRFAVTIQAQDDKGATADQSYTIKLWPQPDNSNPIIISAPDTRHSLKDKGYRYQINAIDPDGDALAYRLVDSPNGALINQDTGELLWFPEASVINGSKANFTVEVADRKGGFDRQTFTVEVFSNLGKIQGLVFDDLNGNGLRDSKLIKGDDPAIVIAIDVSGSTEAPFYGKGEYENVKTVLDAQRTAALLLIDSIIAQGAGNKIKIGIIPHEFNATIQDMDSSLAGLQEYTTALADNNNNGILDVVEILNSYVPNGNNRFTQALKQMEVLVQGYSGTPNLLFMSDGYSRDEIADLQTEGTKLREIITGQGGNVTSFAIGEAALLNTMQAIDPDAIKLTDIEELALIFSGFDERYAIEPLKDGVLMYVDINNNGVFDVGEPSDITDVNVEPNAFGQVTRYQYEFTDLLPGDYVVRPIVTSGYEVTTPIAGFATNTVTLAGETFTNSFGIHKISEPVNIAPEFKTQPQDLYKIKSGELLKYQAVAIDLNSDVISFDLLLAPDGMTVDKETGTVVWLPTLQQVENYYSELREKLASLDESRQQTDVITFQVLLRAQDGKGGRAIQAINIELIPDNTPPVITSLAPANAKPQVGKQFQYQAKAQDVDKDPIAFSLVSGAPAGATISATGLVTWTPVAAQVGKQQFTIKVTDSKGGEALQTLAVNVIAPVPNQLPVIVSQPRDRLRLGSNYFYQIEATDADGDALTYSLDVKPAGMTIQQNTIVWTPAANQSGNQNVVVKVTDSQGGSTTQSFKITVAHQSANNAPTVTSAPNTFVANLDRQYEYQLTGNDADGDPFFWTLDNAPEGMVIDNQTGLLRWNPKQTQLGEHTVSVRITDLNGAYSGQEFTVKVTGANTPPLIISTPNTQGSVGQGYTYTAVAKDAENDAIIYSLVRRPSGMEIDPNTGVISWTPSFTGSYEIQVQAKDGEGANSLQTYTVVVGTVAVNKSPTITSTPVFLADTASIYKYQVTAIDPDPSDTLTYELISAPSGMAINPISGLLSWNSPIVGTYKVVVGVNDGKLGAAQGFTLTARANQLPKIASTNPPTGAIPGVQYVYDAIARDPDGGKLTYAIDDASKAKGMAIDELGRLRWTPTNAQAGVNNVTITIADEAGAAINQTFSINVQPDVSAPTVKLGFAGFNPAELGSRVLFQVQATDNVRIDNLELTVGGKAVILDQFGQAGFTLDTAGVITAIAKATDAAGNVKTETFSIDVFDPNVPQNAPEVRLDLDLITDGIISKVTEIRGLVDDPDDNLSRYRLEVAPLNTENWSTMFEVFGTEVSSGEVLGKFDPTAIDDGIYRVKLTAWDTTGISNSIENQVEVISGELKFGEFQLNFTDISISAGNIPVQLIRTYDTLKLNANSAEMAPGWRVEFRDVDLRTSLGAPDPFYEELGLPDRSRGHKVGDKIYITIGGKREVFELDLKPAVREGLTLSLYGVTLYDPIYKPVGNTKSKLTLTNYQTANITLIDTRPDGILSNLAAVPYDLGNSYFNTKYLLTTEEGIQYEIDAVNGKIDRVGKDLYSIGFSGRVKANANPTEFLEMTDSYIKSSYGAKIDFERDSKGRIVAAVDQDGNKVLYGYDKNGDLVSFTDREGNVTKFEYNTTRKHYLDKVIDPLNRSVIRNEYDALGRLTKVFDAAGNAINMSFDPENQIQVVTDALGHSTTYEYDDRGNTLQVRNALGNITSYTYDQNNNILSEIDPLGNTTTYTYDSNNNVIKEVDVLGYTTTITYDASGNPISSQDHFGNVTQNKFGRNGLIEKIIDPKGTTFSLSYGSGNNPTLVQMSGVDFEKLEYDSNGRMLRQTDAGGRSIKYTYDGSGRVIKTEQIVTDASGVQKTITELFEYNKNGNLIAFTNADGSVKRAEYDASDRLIAEIDVSGRRKEQTYDSAGNVIKRKDYDGYFETYTYDVLGRNTSITDPNGNTVYFEYDALGRTTKVILPDDTANDLSDNPIIAATYDALGNTTKITYPDGSFIEREYNAIGKITKEKNHLGQEIYFTYNVDGTPSSFTDVDGGVTKYVYNNFSALVETIYPDGTRVASTTNTSPITPGQAINTTNNNGHKFTLETNLVNQLTAIVTSQGQRMEYLYNEKGNLIKQTDFNGNVTSYEYDGLGRRTARILPEGQKEEISYNKLNQVTSLKDIAGQSFSYVYDSKGRLTQSTLPDSSTVNYNYNGADNLTAITNSNGTATYEHDVQGRLIKSTDVNGRTIEYGFDSNGFRNLIKTESGSTYYNYTAEGLLTSIVDSRLGTTSFSYDEFGNLLTKTLPNGIIETYEWQATGFLSKLTQTDGSGQVISSYRYERDGLGNVIKIHENVGLLSARTISYTYDYLNRLTNETIASTSDGDRTILYTYDGMGNRTSRNDSLLGVTTYTYGANGQLLSETEGSAVTNYTYDVNGNRILKENINGVTVYQWNSLSQLVNVTKKDGSDTVIDSITYKYDNQGNRISQVINGVETQFLLDYTQPFVQVREEYINGVVSSAYVNDGSQSPLARLSSGQAEFYLGDRQDSTRALANSNGELIQKYVYDSYGRILQETGNSDNSYKYTGEQYDELTGLQYLRFRYNDINTGSFISRDTYEGEITDPLSRNQYSYVKSNPSTYTDPSGHFSLSEFAVSQKIQDILQAGQTAQRFVQLYQLEEKISFFVTAMWLSGVLVELFQDYIEKWPFGGAFANVFGSAGGSASGFTALVPTTFQFFKPPKGTGPAKYFRKIEWGWGAGLSFDPDAGGMASGSTYGTASGFVSFEGQFGSNSGGNGAAATSGAKLKIGFSLKNQLTPDYLGQLSWKPKVSLDITVGQELTLYERKFDVANVGSLTLAKLVLGAEVKVGTSNQALLSKAAYNVYGQLSLGEAVAATGWGTTMGKYKLNLFTVEYSDDGKESGVNIQLFGQPIWESPPSP